ncbi:MAG: class I SAM-dependent methyltransferase [Gammaproteobacteria bacterium]|jgi:trans-aconitate methyltransferase
MTGADHSRANRERFDDIAASWDESPIRTEMARDVAEAILTAVSPSGNESALEFGCGTGLVTALLAPSLAHVLAVDNSPGMLEALEEKRARLALDNVSSQCLDLSRHLPEGPFDLVFSSMTLHHIEDVAGLFVRLAGVLKPGGVIAVADLDAEDGSFHGDKPGIAHNGFDRDDIRAWLESAGLEDVAFRTAHVVHKDRDGGARAYPVFLATAHRSLP